MAARLKGKILNVEERNGVGKDGKPYFGLSVLVLDTDNEVSLVRAFDRDGSLHANAKKYKVGIDVEVRVDKFERLANRTYDVQGSFIFI